MDYQGRIGDNNDYVDGKGFCCNYQPDHLGSSSYITSLGLLSALLIGGIDEVGQSVVGIHLRMHYTPFFSSFSLLWHLQKCVAYAYIYHLSIHSLSSPDFSSLTQPIFQNGRLKADLAIKKSLERTVKSTRLLQQNGSSNYLEVLTAQENLLSAQMSRLENEYNKVAAQIALYQAMP